MPGGIEIAHAFVRVSYVVDEKSAKAAKQHAKETAREAERAASASQRAGRAGRRARGAPAGAVPIRDAMYGAADARERDDEWRGTRAGVVPPHRLALPPPMGTPEMMGMALMMGAAGGGRRVPPGGGGIPPGFRPRMFAPTPWQKALPLIQEAEWSPLLALPGPARMPRPRPGPSRLRRMTSGIGRILGAEIPFPAGHFTAGHLLRMGAAFAGIGLLAGVTVGLSRAFGRLIRDADTFHEALGRQIAKSGAVAATLGISQQTVQAVEAMGIPTTRAGYIAWQQQMARERGALHGVQAVERVTVPLTQQEREQQARRRLEATVGEQIAKEKALGIAESMRTYLSRRFTTWAVEIESQNYQAWLWQTRQDIQRQYAPRREAVERAAGTTQELTEAGARGRLLVLEEQMARQPAGTPAFWLIQQERERLEKMRTLGPQAWREQELARLEREEQLELRGRIQIHESVYPPSKMMKAWRQAHESAARYGILGRAPAEVPTPEQHKEVIEASREMFRGPRIIGFETGETAKVDEMVVLLGRIAELLNNRLPQPGQGMSPQPPPAVGLAQ